jgi:serine protease Do
MKRLFLIALLLALAGVGAPSLRAQSQPAADGGPTAFLTLNLAAGHPLDPFIVSLNGGGPVDASELGEDCVGYISEQPTLLVNWSGETDFVKAFFYSDHDPVLVIQTPAGDYLCNDDANDLLLDPVIQIDHPATGEYRLWVGSYDPGQLLPGVLVLTLRPEINLGAFNLGGLVKRPAIAERLIHNEAVNLIRLPTALLTDTATLRAAPPMALSMEMLPLTTTVTVSGLLPIHQLESNGAHCNGLVEDSPTLTFEWESARQSFNVYFEGELDATLLVEMPDGQLLCNDDSVADAHGNGAAEANLNPLVIVDEPPTGRYHIYVGRLSDAGAVAGVLTLTTDLDAKPTVLAPQAGEEE